MIPLPYRLVALGLLILAALLGFKAWKASVYEDGVQAERAKWIEAARKQKGTVEANNAKEIVRYVEKIRTVERAVPVVRDRLISVCDSEPRWSVSDTGELAQAPAPDAPDRRTDLSQELIWTRENRIQCEALLAVVRPQANQVGAVP